MTSTSHDLFARANSGRDQVVAKTTSQSEKRPGGRDDFDARVRALCVEIWPGRTAVPALAIAADITVRQAQRLFNGEQGFSLDVYARLMRSDVGEHFLRLLMDGCEAAWWHEVGHERQLTAIRKEQKALQRRREQLEGASA